MRRPAVDERLQAVAHPLPVRRAQVYLITLAIEPKKTDSAPGEPSMSSRTRSAFVEEHRVQKFGQIVGDQGVQAIAGAVLADGDPAEPPPAEALAEPERRERDLQQPKTDVVAVRG